MASKAYGIRLIFTQLPERRRMYTSRFLLLLFLHQVINAADLNRHIPELLTVVKQQNETISKHDGVIKRYGRHVRLCCNDPKAFCAVEDEQGVKALLLDHVMKQHLTLNGQGLSNYGKPFAREMTEAFQEDQKREIDEYIAHKTAHIAELKCADCCVTASLCLPIAMHQLLDCSPLAIFLTCVVCDQCAKFSIASATK